METNNIFQFPYVIYYIVFHYYHVFILKQAKFFLSLFFTRKNGTVPKANRRSLGWLCDAFLALKFKSPWPNYLFMQTKKKRRLFKIICQHFLKRQITIAQCKRHVRLQKKNIYIFISHLPSPKPAGYKSDIVNRKKPTSMLCDLCVKKPIVS